MFFGRREPVHLDHVVFPLDPLRVLVLVGCRDRALVRRV